MEHDRIENKKYVVAASMNWNGSMKGNLEIRTKGKFTFITQKEHLSLQRLKKINPKFIFFPHWSYLVPEAIYSNFNCIIFHMTDLPFGRGGSPLQNLITRGIYETKISAIKCVEGLDQGPIYLKKNLSLYGNAEEIYIRAGNIIEDMIVEIIKTLPRPFKQKGKPVYFERRRSQQSDISKLKTLEQIFNHIRMLDAKGYPNAFIDFSNFRFEFSRASLKKEKIIADVSISCK